MLITSMVLGGWYADSNNKTRPAVPATERLVTYADDLSGTGRLSVTRLDQQYHHRESGYLC